MLRSFNRFLQLHCGGQIIKEVERRPIIFDQRKQKYNLRDILNALFYILRTSSQWRNIPDNYPLRDCLLLNIFQAPDYGLNHFRIGKASFYQYSLLLYDLFF